MSKAKERAEKLRNLTEYFLNISACKYDCHISSSIWYQAELFSGLHTAERHRLKNLSTPKGDALIKAVRQSWAQGLFNGQTDRIQTCTDSEIQKIFGRHPPGKSYTIGDKCLGLPLHIRKAGPLREHDVTEIKLRAAIVDVMHIPNVLSISLDELVERAKAESKIETSALLETRYNEGQPDYSFEQ